MEHIPTLSALKLKRQSRILELCFTQEDGGEQIFELSCELLRVYSPSAEVHGHGNPVLVTGKQEVNISNIEAVGRYGVKLTFDDGHDTGLFSFDYLYQLASQQQLWQDYLKRVKDASVGDIAIQVNFKK